MHSLSILSQFFLLATVHLHLAAGWDFIKDFFHKPSDSSAAAYRCPPRNLAYLQSKPTYARTPQECGCPAGMIKCRTGDWYYCILAVNSAGQKNQCASY